MKKRNNKTIATLYYISSICFYLISIRNFFENDFAMGVLFLGLGSTYLCLGSVYLNKQKNEEKDSKDK